MPDCQCGQPWGHGAHWQGPEEFGDLSVRTRNCLYSQGYYLRATVARMTDAELLGLINLGERTLREIRAHIPYVGDYAVPEYNDALRLMQAVY